MTPRKEPSAFELGQRAQEVLATRAAGLSPEEVDSARLLHELQVHQVELEMQNEALRQAQFELEVSRDRYFDLYEFAPVGHLTLTPNGTIAEINLTGATLLGVERKNLLQRRFTDFVVAHERTDWIRLLENVIGRGDKACMELSLQRGDGTVLQVQLDCVSQKFAGSAIPGVGAGDTAIRIVLTDISERKEAEDALDKFFEQPMNLHLIARIDGVILRVNQGWERVLGYREHELAGTRFLDLVHPDDIARTEAEMARLAEGITTFYFENRYRRKHGGYRTLAWWANTSSGRQLIYAVASDITERKKAELELALGSAQLHEANQRLASLAEEQAEHMRVLAGELTHAEQRERDRLYELLHDDVQPLLVAARLSLSGLNARNVRDDYLPVVTQACDHISRVIQVARTLSIQLSPPLIRERGLKPALESLRDWVRSNHRLEVDLVSGPNAEPRDLTMRLICFNAVRELLMNVVKHAGTTRVTVETRLDGEDHLHIAVADRGVGFDPAAATGGSGLAGIERRLRMVGGKLQIDSRVGGGTVASLSVPLRAHVTGQAERRHEPTERRT